ELLRKSIENFELLNINPEKAFKEAKEIEKESQKLNCKECELHSIRVQFRYYKRNNDFEKMIVTADLLSEKAKKYKEPVFFVIAKLYLFESYLFTGLLEKASVQLDEVEKNLYKLDKSDSLSIAVRADYFIQKGNYYLLKKEYNNQLKYIKLSGKEFEKMPDGKNKKKLLYIYYSNLAGSYKDLNELDSARHYALLSQSKDKNHNITEVVNKNLLILGEVEMNQGYYEKALFYFKEAEKLQGYKNHINADSLYRDI